MYFAYGEEETDYLKKKDKRMAEVIDRIGHVERKVDTDLFSAGRKRKSAVRLFFFVGLQYILDK